MTIAITKLLKPGILLLAPVGFSLAVWSLPGTSLYLRGFSERPEVTLGGVLLLLAFYTTAIVVALTCTNAGKSLATNSGFERVRSVEVEKRFYLLISFVALVGVAAAYAAVARSVSIILALTTSSANTLSENLADGSSLATLRYATAIAAPVGLYLYRKGMASLVSVAVNILLLGLNALLTSRLSLVMAIVVFLFLIAQDTSAKRIKPFVLVFGGIVVFAALTIFNSVRNGNYYRLFGVDNPLLMNVYQILTYVGAPTQVSLGVASSISSGKFDQQIPLSAALEAITPTFLRVDKTNKSSITDPSFYGYSVDIAPNLNTNSAFADTYAKYGWVGLALILLALAAFSVLFGLFMRVGGVLAAGAGVIGYGFAEFWRLFLFNQGILVFLVLLTVLGIIVAICSTVSVEKAGVRGK